MDWRNSSYQECNQGRDPSVPLGNDGLDLSPLEVMFVVQREQQLQADLWGEVALALAKYQVGGGWSSSSSAAWWWQWCFMSLTVCLRCA